jgi:TRAP-type C4-dicarboxylate transport system permease small subunit
MIKALEFFYRLIAAPRALLFHASLILIAFGIFHALGWRQFTTVLSGTIPADNTAAEAGFKALAYMASYFGAVLVVPILIIAAALQFGLERVFRVSKGVR